MKSYELFGLMSPRMAHEVLEDMVSLDKTVYRAVLEMVAQARKLRMIFLERQPRVQRNAMVAGMLSRPVAEQVADNLLRTWLLKKQSRLLSEFLDALHVKHEKGVVENLPETVEDAALNEAVNKLLGSHPPELVAIYLHAFNDMNEARWPNLEAILYEDARVMLPQPISEQADAPKA